MAQQYGRYSSFRDPQGMSERTARERAGALEQRAQAPDELAVRATYLDLLAIAAGERVLDVGCGSGVVLRDLARRVAPTGVAVGVDPSPFFLEVARELAEQAGLGAQTEFHEGDARRLPFDNGEFDAVLAVTTLSHVPDGERAIPEIVRVVRPGGRVGLADLDADSMIISHPDRALTRRIIAAGSDHRQVDSWIGRRFPRLLAAVGVQDVRVRAFTTVDQEPSGFFANQARHRAATAAEVSAITDAERQRWLEAFEAEIATGGVVGWGTYLFVWGTRPTTLPTPAP